MAKKIFHLFVFSLLCLTTLYSQKHFKKYPIKSGIIKYQWDGFIKGTQTTYFDDYGYLEANYQDTKSTVMGFTTDSKQITIMRGAEQITIDPEAKTAVKTVNPVLESFGENPTQNYEEVSKKMIKSLGFKKVGNETLLGKPCEIYEGMGKVWIWNGFSLKTETNNMGIQATVTATDLNLNASVSSDKFEVPKGITVTEGDDLMSGEDGEEVPDEAKDLMKNLKNMFKSNEE